MVTYTHRNKYDKKLLAVVLCDSLEDNNYMVVLTKNSENNENVAIISKVLFESQYEPIPETIEGWVIILPLSNGKHYFADRVYDTEAEIIRERGELGTCMKITWSAEQ